MYYKSKRTLSSYLKLLDLLSQHGVVAAFFQRTDCFVTFQQKYSGYRLWVLFLVHDWMSFPFGARPALLYFLLRYQTSCPWMS